MKRGAEHHRKPGGGYLRLLNFLAMRPGEERRTLLIFAYLFLIIAAYLLLKAIRNSFFISEFGAMKLPYAMIGIAVLAGIFAAVYIRLAGRWSTTNLVFWSLILFASNVFIFWLLALQGFPWLYPLLYLWSGVFGVLGPTQVWTVASELFTTREAKRLFGVVGVGGILGAVAGGALAGRLAERIGTTHLLLIVCGMLLLAAAVVRSSSRFLTVPRTISYDRQSPKNLTQSLQLVMGSGHLRLLAGLVFITALATTSVDFQFSVVAEQSISERDALTAFFGRVYGSISLLSFLIQILLTSRVLATAGVGISILLLPLSLATGSVAFLFSGALWAGVFLKGSDGALKHSLDRSCRELMYLPVPSTIRAQAKSTIDTVMDRLGDGSAGVLQLLITAGLGLGLQYSLGVNFLLVIIWIYLAWRLKAAYVEQLRVTIGRPKRDTEEIPASGDADTQSALLQILRQGNEVEQLAVLEWIYHNSIHVDDQLLLDIVHTTKTRELRNAALAQLLSGKERKLPPELLAELESEGHSILVAAIDLLVESEPRLLRDRLQELLDQAGETTRLTAVAFMVRRLGPEFEPFATQVFDALLANESPPAARAAAIRALALLPAGSAIVSRLDVALHDSDPLVQIAAIETAGRLERTDLIEQLVVLLDRPPLRQSVRRSLTRIGEPAVSYLLHSLEDMKTPSGLRRHLPGLIGELYTPRGVDVLVDTLDDSDLFVQQGSLEALRRIRRRSPELPPFRGPRLQLKLFEQISSYEEMLVVEESLRRGSVVVGGGIEWLVDALENERLRILRRIFMLLALEYPESEVTRSWFAVRNGSARDRANAVELLDNILPKRIMKRLVRLLEPPDHHLGSSFMYSNQRSLSRSEALCKLIGCSNPWLAACALYAGRKTATPGLLGAVREAAGSTHRVLREEAEVFLIEMEGGAQT
jgi:AAA family ATP:ADP antiporter